VGILQANRGEPSEVSNSGKMEKNEIVVRDNGKIMALSWMDKQEFKMISTKHDGSTTKGYHKSSAQRTEAMKRKCVTEYKYMVGDGHVDQMIASSGPNKFFLPVANDCVQCLNSLQTV